MIEPEMVAMRNWTRSWWNEERDNYQVVTSDAVVDELETGDHPMMDICISSDRSNPSRTTVARPSRQAPLPGICNDPHGSSQAGWRIAS